MRWLRELNPTVRGFLLVAAIAGAVFALNLETTVLSLYLVLRIVFFLAIAIVVYMFWRDRLRHEISTWPDRAQRVFYGAAALVLVDLAAYFWPGRVLVGLDAFAFVVVLLVCGFSMYRVWRDQRHFA